jgi:polyribonucleotide nucleotidyltransferase
VDGRSPAELRPIECHTEVLPVVHGSALFQRGETQALVSLTLGCTKDSQEIDAITGGVQSKSFYLHYNFPPFSVGETGRIGGVGRREIGHGALAERSLLPVIPPEEKFPYTIRVVSDILESNGSSSMASVCGGCLALMDAGVPISDMVAGISVGLVTRRDDSGNIAESVILTDINGSEDHFGDMDFKLAGTRKGITGIQLDLKISGLPLELAKQAISQSKNARMAILDTMSATRSEPRQELSKNAPRVHTMQIDPGKIGALIGPGGKTIKKIVELTGAKIDINEDNSGKVLVYANGGEALEYAINEINAITSEIEQNKVYRGIVKSVKEFGVFVECLPGQEGLVHVSELADFHVDDPNDICKVGDEIIVKCIGSDEKGRVRLSRRAVICEAKGISYTATSPKSSSRGNSRGPSRFGNERSFVRSGERSSRFSERGHGNGERRYARHER